MKTKEQLDIEDRNRRGLRSRGAHDWQRAIDAGRACARNAVSHGIEGDVDEALAHWAKGRRRPVSPIEIDGFRKGFAQTQATGTGTGTGTGGAACE